ncbi:MAG: NAD(P)/FAD-dependent oxidoreductase [Bdellovibrio sp.]|nr:NAD(P)/FAD-dependent oxidoreductase [Bdellovibrio sp.]
METSNATTYDVIIIGAGAAGMMCAIQVGRRGRSVLAIDHAHSLGKKILISGGGRCNFTNLGANSAHYLSANPHFCKSALSRFPPERFIEMVQGHQIPFHEKKLGQLFCDHSAHDILEMLKLECQQAQVNFQLGCKVLHLSELKEEDQRFQVQTDQSHFICNSLVIATGGQSYPSIGASDFGFAVARQFGLNLIEIAPALDGFVFAEPELSLFRNLSGISLDCEITALNSSRPITFRESLLFTHKGLSGPVALQASLYWRKNQIIRINLVPEIDLLEWILNQKKKGNRSLVKTVLGQLIPNRLAEQLCQQYFPTPLPLPQVPEKELAGFCQMLQNWQLTPSGTIGYTKAEVTRGGVDTNELSSKTMEVKKHPGLYFIGEVVDVTGQLGGYNFQWAWSSGWAAGQSA